MDKKLDYKENLFNMEDFDVANDTKQSSQNNSSNKKILYDSYKKFEFKDNCLVIIITNNMCQCFNEDAVLMNRILKYKLTLLRKDTEEYVKVNFPKSRLNSIVDKIKKEQRLNIAIAIKKTDDYFDVKLIKTDRAIHKSQFVTKDDVESSIIFLIENEECYKDFTIRQVQRGAKAEYQLHIKATEMFKLVSSTLYNYVPKKHKWMHELFTKEWADMIKNVNLTRNFGGDIRSKCLTHHKISAILDTLKDYTNSIYEIKGFKNSKQYFHIYQTITEIAKINRGILSKCQSETQKIAS